ncbi:MAG: PadR family transcriptional regulator [Thaumarchaeota archaeon]|nr:PadR family transcriptional regulator [Nitrososphaerota archaeon]
MWPFGLKFHRRRGLRAWILSLLNKSPKNGAEIMDSIEEMSQGWWRPSPGSIYPLLESMQGEELIKKREDGRYELTDKSKNEIDWAPSIQGGQPQSVDGMLNDMSGFVSYFEDLNKTDKSKIGANRDKMKQIAERLLELIREGGEKGE